MSSQGGQTVIQSPGGEGRKVSRESKTSGDVGEGRKVSKEGKKTSYDGKTMNQAEVEGSPTAQLLDSPPELRRRSKEERRDGTLKASSVHQEEVGGGSRAWSQTNAQSTPSQSGSSGRSSRGCTPPLGSHWSPMTQSSTSRSCSPSNKSSSGSKKVPRGSRVSKRGSPGTVSLENSRGDGDPFMEMSMSPPHNDSPSDSQLTSAKSLQKLQHGHPSASSFSSVAGSWGVPSSTDSKRSKRKSWMQNAINPTYRSRCNDLRRNFPGLPPDETLIVDYSCALQKDILVHGRLYVTTNFLCFYANIFRWETAVTIRWREVTAMTKEKTALVIPNAVQICTGADKFFFTSFAARDKTHMMLFRLWQNALLDSPASQTEIWSWVQAVYGEQTNNSRYSDDPDVSNDGGSSYSYDGLDSSAPAPRTRLYSNIQEDEEENKMPGNKGFFLPDRAGDQPLLGPHHPDGEGSGNDSDQSDLSGTELATSPLSLAQTRISTSPTKAPRDILTYEVWRQNKDAREIISKNLAIDIDDLFTLLFTNSKFFYDFQAERKTFDIVQCPWQHSDQSEDKFREVSYTLNLNHSIGPKTSRATEVQTMRSNSVPGHIYNVEVETTNADIPYADSFYVVTHYCVVKVAEGESLLTVLCDIKYKKPPWGVVKSFIEKNCWAGIEEHYTALASSLQKQVEGRMAADHPEAKHEGQGGKKKTRRQRNQQRRMSASGESSLGNSVGCSVSVAGQAIQRGPVLLRGSIGVPSPRPGKETKQPNVFPLLVCMLGLLCLLNLVLVFKIWVLESNLAAQTAATPTHWPRGGASWVEMLRQQEALHHQDIVQWRKATEAASLLLRETERNIVRLTQESLNRDSNHQLLKQLLQLEEAQSGNMGKDAGEEDTKEGEAYYDRENIKLSEKFIRSLGSPKVPATRTPEERRESGKPEL